MTAGRASIRPRKMRTLFGRRLGFELRSYAQPKQRKTGSWVVVYPDRDGRKATVEEVQLWKALPNKMREVAGDTRATLSGLKAIDEAREGKA
jgi:hypothetical protein